MIYTWETVLVTIVMMLCISTVAIGALYVLLKHHQSSINTTWQDVTKYSAFVSGVVSVALLAIWLLAQ